MDVGLVVCRYGDVTKVGDGVCVPGDGGAHHEVVFRLIIFRPFVEEVCLGHILESNEEGIKIALGEFFSDIFIPAYWMLRPSEYCKETGLWVWTPDYGNDDDGDDENQKYEMEIGAEIRFKVKGINFTQVTNTVKGVQATTTSTTSRLTPGMTIPSRSCNEDKELASNDETIDTLPVRKRSSSVDLSDSMIPVSMHITASICEDGLGLVSWWSNQEFDDEDFCEGDYHEDALPQQDEYAIEILDGNL